MPDTPKAIHPEIDAGRVISDVLKVFLVRNAMFPVYEQKIRSSEDVEDLAPGLPLVCLWGECPRTGIPQLTVNSFLVGRQLEALVPSGHPEFAGLQKRITDEILKAAQAALSEVLKISGGVPLSLVLGREAPSMGGNVKRAVRQTTFCS